MLEQVLLIRHGQSQEDIHPSIRSTVHDRRISITSKGKLQVQAMLNELEHRVAAYANIKLICSPSNRARQTMMLFCSYFAGIDFEILYEDSIRNLNWGTVDEHTVRQVEQERYQAGVLNYQFPGGDNTPVFVKNIESFVARLLSTGRIARHQKCAVIFTHGFALRVLAKAFLSISDEDFRYLANPPNCWVSFLRISKSGVTLEKPIPKITFEI